MTRILQCHDARVVLGRTVQLPNDPYSLPDAWIDTDVKEEDGNYVAVTKVDRVSDNIRLLRRAKAFAATQASQTIEPAPAPPPKI